MICRFELFAVERERHRQAAILSRRELFAWRERERSRKAFMLSRRELFAWGERETQEGSYTKPPRAIRVGREGDPGRQLCC